ncbi:hypothetical protein D6D03_07258 [Aureobasidium pullulans]|nr:hypothetical protein D6D03_07258 [Aureobasidium pullulans]
MDDPLKGYFNHQGVRHIGFKNHRKYRRSYHGSLNHRHHHYNVRQLNSKYAYTRPFHMIHPNDSQSQPRPSSIYPLNSATRSTTISSIPTATKPSTWKCTLDPTSDLDSITRLTAVSPTTTHQSPQTHCFWIHLLHQSGLVEHTLWDREATYRDGNAAREKDDSHDKGNPLQLRF